MKKKAIIPGSGNVGPLAETEDQFFLPDLCESQRILFLVLITELLVFVLAVFESGLIEFDWGELGLMSLYVQWLVLASAAVLCNLRSWLVHRSMVMGVIISYGVILIITLVGSIIARFVVDGGISESAAQGKVVRDLLIAAIMSGIAFRYLYVQARLRRQEQAELNSRIQALQSRIRPHFLFNSMNIIASLISVEPELAEQVVEDLSELFRATLHDTSDEPVLLSEELSLCEKYVHIESLRLDERLRVEWNVEVDPDSVRIPLLTLQPLLENAIYHGIQPLAGGGVVHVSIRRNGPMLEIVISNPLGPSAQPHVKGNRMALENIRHRLEATYGPGAELITRREQGLFHTTVRYPSDRSSPNPESRNIG